MRNYAGNANSYPVNVQIVDDGDLDAAANFNVPEQGSLDRTAWLRVNLPLHPLNWPSVVTRTGGVGTERIMSAFWDTFNNRWILLTGMTGGTTSKFVNVSTDGGVTFTLLATLSPTGNGYLLAGVCDPGSAKSIICPSAQTFFYVSTNGATWVPTTIPTVVSTYTAALFFKGLFVAIGTGSSATAAHVVTTPDTAVWTDRTAAIPAGLATMSNPGTSWVAASNGTRVVAIPVQSASLTSYATMTSTDGITWTAGAFTNVNIVPGDIVAALAYSAADGLFMLMLQGTNTKIMTSPDGLTWTYLRTLTGRLINALAAIGTVWVGQDVGTSPTTLIYSVNAGLTWSLAPLALPADANPPAAATVTPGLVATSPTQFLTANAVAAYASLKAGTLPTF